MRHTALGEAAARVLAGMSHVHGIELMPGISNPPGRRRHPRTPLANLSRNHPDYGCTVAEHQARKMARDANPLRIVVEESGL